MNDRLNDWIDFRAGRADFDKSHFLSLFNSQLSDMQLRSVFSGIPGGEDMYIRTKRVLDAWSPDRIAHRIENSGCDANGIMSAAQSWLKELSKFCGDMGQAELQRLLERVSIVVRHQGSFVVSRDPNSPQGWLLVFIGDEVDASIGDSDPVIDALMEALYGIASDYYICWYVMQSIIPLSLNFDHYFEMWSQGAHPVFTDREMVLLVDGPCPTTR